jgi:predicted DNA-binding transcriptional regulator AlpA
MLVPLEMDMTSVPVPTEKLHAPAKAAELLGGMSLSWLAKSRLTGTGPRFVKIGRSVRYRDSALREYIQARTRRSTSET